MTSDGVHASIAPKQIACKVVMAPPFRFQPANGTFVPKEPLLRRAIAFCTILFQVDSYRNAIEMRSAKVRRRRDGRLQ
jgi:hypothetical protein